MSLFREWQRRILRVVLAQSASAARMAPLVDTRLPRGATARASAALCFVSGGVAGGDERGQTTPCFSSKSPSAIGLGFPNPELYALRATLRLFGLRLRYRTRAGRTRGALVSGVAHRSMPVLLVVALTLVVARLAAVLASNIVPRTTSTPGGGARGVRLYLGRLDLMRGLDHGGGVIQCRCLNLRRRLDHGREVVR